MERTDIFKTKEDATKALTCAKMFFQDEIAKQENYAPSIVGFHLGLIDKAILYIDPEANINQICDEVSKKGNE